MVDYCTDVDNAKQCILIFAYLMVMQSSHIYSVSVKLNKIKGGFLG